MSLSISSLVLASAAVLALACAAPDAAPSPESTTKSAVDSPDTLLRNDTSAWTEGSVTAARGNGEIATLVAVRTAGHPAYDRIVFEFAGKTLPNYTVGFSSAPITACGSGEVVPLAGEARLELRFEPANAHDENGRLTVNQRSRKPALPTLLELKLTCDFEAVVAWAASLSDRKAYRVLELRNPSRLIIDLIR
jgi:hypothetical protein